MYYIFGYGLKPLLSEINQASYLLFLTPQVKTAYVNFVNHCYVDTEVEMKEIYTSNHIWKLFDNFLVDMSSVRLCHTERSHLSAWYFSNEAADAMCKDALRLTCMLNIFTCCMRREEDRDVKMSLFRKMSSISFLHLRCATLPQTVTMPIWPWRSMWQRQWWPLSRVSSAHLSLSTTPTCRYCFSPLTSRWNVPAQGGSLMATFSYFTVKIFDSRLPPSLHLRLGPSCFIADICT